MPLAFQPSPWSGTPTSVWASQGAAVPVMSGSGFNWAAIVGGMYGGPISHYRPTVRGVPMTASFVRRYGGLRGLGQDDGSIMDTIGTDIGTQIGTDLSQQTLSLPTYTPLPTSTGSTTSGGTNWTSLLNNLITSGSRVATVAELPPGSTIFPSGVISSGTNLNPLTSGTGSMLPILLIAGAVVALLFVMKK